MALVLYQLEVWNTIFHQDFERELRENSTLPWISGQFYLVLHSTGAEFINEYFFAISAVTPLDQGNIVAVRGPFSRTKEPRTDYLVNFTLDMYPRWAKKKSSKIQDGS